MWKLGRVLFTAVLFASVTSAVGCCHLFSCCDCWCDPPPPPRRAPEGPPANLPPGDNIVPSAGPLPTRPGSGAYGGSGP